MNKYLLDTNILRGIQASREGNIGIDSTRAAAVKCAVCHNGDCMTTAIEVIYELVAHLNIDEQESFGHFKGAVGIALEFSNGSIVEGRDYVLQTAIAGSTAKPPRAEQALNFCKIISGLSQFNDLYKHVTDGAKLETLLDRCAEIRQEVEGWKHTYTESMMDSTEIDFIKDYRNRLQAGETPKIDSKDKRKDVLDFLNKHQEYEQAFWIAVAELAGLDLPLNAQQEALLRAKLCGLYCAFKAIWEKVPGGIKFTKRENMNDRVDLDLLYYLSDDDVIVVSNEQLVPKDCAHSCRVMTFDELASSLSV